MEAFAVEELRRQLTWRTVAPARFHYRDGSGNDVDAVLEERDGRIVGIDVKASATVTSSDTKGLRALRTLAGEIFVRGIVLYTGAEVVPLGDHLVAVPIFSPLVRVTRRCGCGVYEVPLAPCPAPTFSRPARQPRSSAVRASTW